MMLFLLSACINETIRFRRIEVTGTLSSEDSTSIMYISAHHAWYETDVLAHPAELFEQSQFEPGEFSWTLDIPITDTFAEGLLIYVWQDTDGDEVFCGLNGTTEYSDMAYFEDDSVFSVQVELTPQYECAAPETLYSNFE